MSSDPLLASWYVRIPAYGKVQLDGGMWSWLARLLAEVSGKCFFFLEPHWPVPRGMWVHILQKYDD